MRCVWGWACVCVVRVGRRAEWVRRVELVGLVGLAGLYGLGWAGLGWQRLVGGVGGGSVCLCVCG